MIEWHIIADQYKREIKDAVLPSTAEPVLVWVARDDDEPKFKSDCCIWTRHGKACVGGQRAVGDRLGGRQLTKRLRQREGTMSLIRIDDSHILNTDEIAEAEEGNTGVVHIRLRGKKGITRRYEEDEHPKLWAQLLAACAPSKLTAYDDDESWYVYLVSGDVKPNPWIAQLVEGPYAQDSATIRANDLTRELTSKCVAVYFISKGKLP